MPNDPHRQSSVRTALIELIVTLVTLALVACTLSPASLTPAPTPTATLPAITAVPEKTVVYGLFQEPDTLNPFLRTQTVAGEVGRFLDEGLLEVDPDGNYIPALATTVPTTENGLVTSDGLIITYPLRDDVRWSDGAPFTCEDVVFTWEAVLDPASGAVSPAAYQKIDTIRCPSEHAVQIRFKEFYAPFLTLFDAILPRHATGEPAAMPTWAYNRQPVGTGPFVLQEWAPGDRIVLAKNSFYRGAPDLPKLDKVIIRFFPDLDTGVTLLANREIDILWGLSEADLSTAAAIPGVTVHSIPGPAAERLVLNLADPTLDATTDPLAHPHPLLGDLRVRQAIQLGVDKARLVSELLGDRTSVGTSELSQGWAKCDVPVSVYDPAQASALLDAAGFTDQDGDGVRECHGCQYAEEGAALHLKFQTTTGVALREQSQQMIQTTLRAIGIDLAIENVPSSELFASWDDGAFRKHGNFDILMYTSSEGIDPQDQMAGLFHSHSLPSADNRGAGFNYSRWIYPAADAVLGTAGATPDPATRRANYQTVCELVSAELPLIYLYDRAEIHATRDNLRGFVVNPWGNQSWNAEVWDTQ